MQAERSASLDLLVGHAFIGDGAHDPIANQAPAAPDGGQALAVGEGLSSRALIAFHSDHKLLLMAHSQAAYQRMGRMLANLGDADLDAVASMYFTALMTALTRRATRKRHADTLQQMARYLRRSIDSDDKQELVQNIDADRPDHIVPALLQAAS